MNVAASSGHRASERKASRTADHCIDAGGAHQRSVGGSNPETPLYPCPPQEYFVHSTFLFPMPPNTTASTAPNAPAASAANAPSAQRVRMAHAPSEEAAGDAVFPQQLSPSAAASAVPVCSATTVAAPLTSPPAAVEPPATAPSSVSTASAPAPAPVPPPVAAAAQPPQKSRLDRVSTTSSPGFDECRAFLGARHVPPVNEGRERDSSQSPPPVPQASDSDAMDGEAAGAGRPEERAEAEAEAQGGEPDGAEAEEGGEADGAEGEPEPVEQSKALDDPVRKSLLKRQ